MSHDNNAHNMDLDNAWNAKMRAEEKAEQEDEDRRLVMQFKRHNYRGDPWVKGFCEQCGVAEFAHGKDFPT